MDFSTFIFCFLVLPVKGSSAISYIIVDQYFDYTLYINRTFFDRYSGLMFQCTCDTCANVSLSVDLENNGQFRSDLIPLTKDKLNSAVWMNEFPLPLWILNENEKITLASATCVYNGIESVDKFQMVYRECLPDEVKESGCKKGICISKLSADNRWKHCQSLSFDDCALAHKNMTKSPLWSVCSHSETYPTMCEAVVNFLFSNKNVPPPLYEGIGFDLDLCRNESVVDYSLMVVDANDTFIATLPFGASVKLPNDWKVRFMCSTTVLPLYLFNNKTVACNNKDEIDITNSLLITRILQTTVIQITATDGANISINTYANLIRGDDYDENKYVQVLVDVKKMCKDDHVHSIQCYAEVKGLSYYNRLEFEPARIVWFFNNSVLKDPDATFYFNYSILRIRSAGKYTCQSVWNYISNPLYYNATQLATVSLFSREKEYPSVCAENEEEDAAAETPPQDNDLLHIIIALVIFIASVAIIIASVTLYSRWSNRKKLKYILGDSTSPTTSTTSVENASPSCVKSGKVSRVQIKSGTKSKSSISKIPSTPKVKSAHRP